MGTKDSPLIACWLSPSTRASENKIMANKYHKAASEEQKKKKKKEKKEDSGWGLFGRAKSSLKNRRSRIDEALKKAGG